MTWLREAVSEPSGKASSKRVIALVAAVALAFAVVVLALAAACGVDVAVALGTVTVPLAGLGGYTYVNSRATQDKRDAQGADRGGNPS